MVKTIILQISKTHAQDTRKKPNLYNHNQIGQNQ